MSRDPKEAPLSADRLEPSTTATVQMTEIDGMEQGAILRFTDMEGAGTRKTKEVRTCIGDLYVIVNALRDYANVLESVIPEWGLTGFHAAIYRLHATRCQGIAEKYAAAIGYDYDAAMEHCQKRQAKEKSDTGLDGMEALARRR